MLEGLHRIVLHHAEVAEPGFFGAQQQMTDTCAVHLDPQEIFLGMRCRERQQILAVAEADLHDQGCASAKAGGEVKGRNGCGAIGVLQRWIDAEARPALGQRPLLGRRDASGAQHEAADAATPVGLVRIVVHRPVSMTASGPRKACRNPAYLRKLRPRAIRLQRILAMPDASHTEILRYVAGGRELASYLAWDPARDGQRPGVLVLPEWWGLNDYARRRARELAGLGFAALAVDVYGDGREAADAAEAGALMGGLFTDIPALNERLRAAYEQLRAHPQVDPERIGAMGYCLGGALSLHMGRLGMPLRGVVSFHGALTAAHQAQPGEFKPAVLICHGEADGLVPAEDQANFHKEMQALGVDYQFVSYPDAKHGFTNPEATEKGKKNNLPLAYDEKADRQSLEDMKAFWSKVFR